MYKKKGDLLWDSNPHSQAGGVHTHPLGLLLCGILRFLCNRCVMCYSWATFYFHVINTILKYPGFRRNRPESAITWMSVQNYEQRLQLLEKSTNADIVFKDATESRIHIIVDNKRERVLCRYCNLGDNLKHTVSSLKKHTHWKQLCDDSNCPKVFFARVSSQATKQGQ